MKKVDLTGRKFGKLLVLKEAQHVGKNKNRAWLCRCDCGTEKIIIGYNLTSGKSSSCGCGQREAASKVSKTHGLSNTRLHRIWKGIRQRCYNQNAPSYKYYGAKGIVLCDEWRDDFTKFYKWSLSNGYSDDVNLCGYTLDRIDVKRGYCPNNCRWVTFEKQQNNKLNSLFLTIGEEKLTIAEWADKHNTNKQTLYSKLYRLLDQLDLLNQNVAEFEIKLK